MKTISINSKQPKNPKATQKLLSYNFIGLVVATIFFYLSVLPSILPRPWLFQGLISGFSMAVGYGLGVLVSFTVRWMTEMNLPKNKIIADKSWKILKIIMPAVFVVSLLLGIKWQNEVRLLVGQGSMSYSAVLPIGILSIITALGTISLSRRIRSIYRKGSAKLGQYVPRRISVVVSTVVAVSLFFWVATGVFENFFVSQANRIYSARNDSTPDGTNQPMSPMRSGSPGSLIAWDDLGFTGKNITGRGPTVEQLSAFDPSKNAKDPIRVYAGLKSADTPAGRAQLAVEELKRTGAFERKILIIANTTGTGWLEPQAIDSIEYMYSGDSAIVTQQYSYLPSWISFLVDQQNAADAGTALFDAVRGEWAKLPEGSRPKLVTYGLSLGSYSGQSAYSGVNDLRLSVDGALFLGTPNSTRLWRSITDTRDAGSLEILPVYRSGTSVRFASNKTEINQSPQTWQEPRILYVQHASDPVVWFDFSLMTQNPDWLNEERGSDVSSRTRWYPFVTFAQVAVDQFFGTSVPNGHGHNYPDIIVDAWASVAAPDDWTPEKSDKLQAIIDTYSNE